VIHRSPYPLFRIHTGHQFKPPPAKNQKITKKTHDRNAAIAQLSVPKKLAIQSEPAILAPKEI
jgi:hypothetical protein